jgi:hypothetical protein
MKRIAGCVVLFLLLGLMAWAQDQQQGSQQNQQEEQQQQQQQPQRRPTLGPSPAPSLGGPRTSSTTDARKLLRIRTLYIDRIDNNLGESLVESIGKIGRFRIVTDPKAADATLRGSCLESRRLKRVHSEVFISDKNGSSVWQDNIYRPYNPPSLRKAVTDTATMVAQHLSDSIREAER